VKRFAVCAIIGAALTLFVLFFLHFKTTPPSSVVAQNAVNSQASNPANRANPAQPSLTSLNPLSATASVKADDSLVALAAFSNWAEQFLSNSPSASVARGEVLAWKRREAMLELIETNPEKALAQAAPFGWRSTLPASSRSREAATRMK